MRSSRRMPLCFLSSRRIPATHGTFGFPEPRFFLSTTPGIWQFVCFFVLSGYVLTNSYDSSRQSWPALVVKRMLRLFIPMLAACALAWAFMALHLLQNLPAGLLTHSGWLTAQFLDKPDLTAAVMEPVRDLVLFHAPMAAASYDSSLWTMPIEAAGSLLLVTLLVMLRYAGRYKMLLAGLLLGGLGLVLWQGYLGLFCAGALWRLFGPSRAVWQRFWPVAPPLLAGFWMGTMPYSPARWAVYARMAACVQPYVKSAGNWDFTAPAFYHALGALVIMGAVSRSAPLQATLAGRVPRYLGQISFPLYLLHVPLIMVFECGALLLAHRHGVGDGLGGLLGVLTGIGTALLAASIVGPWLERFAIGIAAWVESGVDRAAYDLARKTLLFWKQKKAKKMQPL